MSLDYENTMIEDSSLEESKNNFINSNYKINFNSSDIEPLQEACVVLLRNIIINNINESSTTSCHLRCAFK